MRIPTSACLLAAAMTLCVSPLTAAAQSPDAVGSRNAQTGPVSGGRRAGGGAPVVGARMPDGGLLATVELLDNINRCPDDGTSECVVYVVSRDEADPDVAYAGNAMVRNSTLMRVMLVEERKMAQANCALAGIAPISWQEIVDPGPTIAALGPEVLEKIVDPNLHAGSPRFRLLWCPASDARSASSALRGQSWRLRLSVSSIDPRATNPNQ